MLILNRKCIDWIAFKAFINSDLGITLVDTVLNAIFTTILGLITFKIYQRYRNKKDNSLLYIQVIKLKKELVSNLDKLKVVELEHEKVNELCARFKDEEALLEQIEGLNIFAYIDPVYDNNGNQVDEEYGYENVPDHTIDMVKKGIQDILSEEEYDTFENENNIEELEHYVEKLQHKSLIKELISLQEKIENHQIGNRLNLDGITYLKIKLMKFNKLKEDQRLENLDLFCKHILNENNPIKELLNKYYEYKKLKWKSKHKSKNKITIEFSLWHELETELIAVFDSEKYLLLDEFYRDNKTNIVNINNKQQVKDNFNRFNETIFPIINALETDIEDILSKTNRYFKNI